MRPDRAKPSVSGAALRLTSPQNPRVKEALRLRRRSHRDESDRMLVEGYREILRAVENGHRPLSVFFCPDLFLGGNEPDLLGRCREGGAELVECSAPVFGKMSYRDRPDGLLAVAPQVRRALGSLGVPRNALLVVAESIEKPGNLGSILRSADAAGTDAVIVCDRCTDINNPNVVRASIGALFSVPVAEAPTRETLVWLRDRRIRILAATPHAKRLYTDVDLRTATAIVVGAEQYGLSSPWMEQADVAVRIPMKGQSDSLNVAAAATILLFEAVRQRGAA
jgi:TrmH family RNA methyltransferase